ncbi:MAG: calcium-translocating P-type ATPase, PMCA-type [Bacteroidaceae bacterium]|nr:calcium-translocating P-type ATPase, PMCA-type [Bacteroidaceae bacterium]
MKQEVLHTTSGSPDSPAVANSIKSDARRRLHGLTPSEVLASRAAHGSNVLTPRQRTPWWKKLGEKFTDPLIIILLVAAALSIGISCYEYFGLGADSTAFFEPVGIIIAIALATGLAFWFEQKADREFSLLNRQNDLEPVRVIRRHVVSPEKVGTETGSATDETYVDRETLVPRSELVVGDLVLLATGDEIPADGLLLESTQMQVDESTLTGEPVCRKSCLPEEQDSDATFPTNVVLRGTKLLEGHGLMQITAVGDSTENGRVFTEAQIDSTVRTPLNEQLDNLGLLISRISYAIAGLVVLGRVVMWFVSGPDSSDLTGSEGTTSGLIPFLTYLLQSFMLAVTLIVVAVPEGLPMAVTLSLAYSMRRMLQTNNLVRRMHACETMGAATVICTDKTGTLTQNQMRVAELWTPSSARQTSSANISSTPLSHPLCDDAIAKNIAVNSTASLEDNRVLGNPTEGALLLWLHEQGIDYTTIRSEAQVVEEVPFTTERKYMATRIKEQEASSNTLYIKGAPEIVLAMCGAEGSGEQENTSEDIAALLLSWQQRGLRTLALAHAQGDGTPSLDALVAIADPVRADVPAAVRECLEAGIAVKIVTGDTPATAKEIARQIGLEGGEVVTGPEVAALSDEELRARAKDILIIARARPMDKKRLVEALQAQGEVVAVTGDGTNDAPALKAAHIGLSMGDGTSVAKESSDITIIDNSFASIGRAVMWGRSLYRNIQRFILFQMTVNVCACLTVLAGTFMGTDAPLTVTQMLWVNLIMDTFAAMALASLPPSESVMHERPRDRRKFIISTPMWHFILGVGGAFFVTMTAVLWIFEHANVTDLSDLIGLIIHGQQQWIHDPLSPFELSIFFTTFVMLQFWNLFNARAFLTGRSAFDLRGCNGFLFIAGLIFIGQILIVQLGGQMFNVRPLEWDEWLVIIAITSPVLIAGEGVRLLKKL